MVNMILFINEMLDADWVKQTRCQKEIIENQVTADLFNKRINSL